MDDDKVTRRAEGTADPLHPARRVQEDVERSGRSRQVIPKRAGGRRGPQRLAGEDKLGLAEAALFLGITEKMIRGRVARGDLPHRRWGKRLVFSKRAIEAYFDQLPGLSVAEALEARKARDGR